MIKFVKFFGITLFFLITLTVGTMYISVLRGEGLIRPEAVIFYTIVFFGYGFTLWYVFHKEKQLEIEQAEMAKRLALEEVQKYKKELESLKKELEEYKRKLEGQQ